MRETSQTSACQLKVIENDKINEPPFTLSEDGHVVEPVFSFLMFIFLRNFSAQTIRAYAYDLLMFYRFLRSSRVVIDDLKREHLSQFIQWQRRRKDSARTVNRRLTVMRSFLNAQFNKLGDRIMPDSSPLLYKGQRNTALLGKTWIKGNIRNSWKLKVPTRIISPLSTMNIQSLLVSIKTYRDRSIVFLMLFCGLRSFEILNLKLNDIDIIDSTIRVCGKGNRERILPISGLVRKTLTAYLDYERPEKCHHDRCFILLKGSGRGKPMNREALRRFFRYRRRVVKRIHPHLLRHTFCTQMMSQGVPVPIIQKLMGHADIQTTMAYTHISDRDVSKEYHKAMEALQKAYDMDKG